MNIRDALRTKVARDLNLLYTVPPFQRDGCPDSGWFCREHALHVAVLCAMLGIPADIRLGEFHLCSPMVVPTSSGEAGDGHAWCRVKSAIPVDLSMTFELYAAGEGPQLDAPVFGTGRNGDYIIQYHLADQPEPKAPTHPNYIVFREHERLSHTASSLTRNPYVFLHAPDRASPTNWDALYGPEIYARISYHCFSLATRRAKPIPNGVIAREAPKWISSQYPSAFDDVLLLLKDCA